MKTSTKLLIALLLCIPLSMAVYGYLLKQQFDAGNFFQDISSNKFTYVFKTLPPFKHVVVDGLLYVVDESLLTRNQKVKTEHFVGTRTTAIGGDYLIEFTDIEKENGYSILSQYEDFIKTKIKSDTLYISLFKLNGKDLYVPNVAFLSINSSDLKSLKLSNGNYRIKEIVGKDLSVKLQFANLAVAGVTLDSLHVFSTDDKKINIDSSNIALFQYRLLNKSKLILGDNKIKTFKDLGSDSLAEISVQGKAKDMEKFLPALSQSVNQH